MTTAPPVQPGPQQRVPLSPARRWVLGVGLVLSLAAIGWGALNLISVLGRTTDQRSATLPATSDRLSVHSSGGAVRVTGGDVTDVRITTKLRYGLGEPRLTQESGPDGIRLEASCPWWSSICSTSYEIVVPRRFEVKAESSGGSVTVRGVTGRVEASSSGGSIRLLEVSGPVSANSSGGGVTVDGAGGSVQLHSSGGSITGNALRATHVRADSSGGGVRLTFAVPPDLVNAESSGGSVQVSVPDVAGGYRVDATASGGSRTVEVPIDPDSPRLISADSSGGSVRVLRLPSG